MAARVGESPEAEHGLGQRRDPEARIREVLDAELDADHLAIRYIHLRGSVSSIELAA